MKKQPLLPLDKIRDLDYIKFMLTVSASSCRFGKITLTEDGKTFDIRGPTHCLLVSPFGTGKSSSICRISNVDVIRANDITMPGLIGSITQSGQAIVGSVFKADGKVLLIDEAQSIKSKVKDPMNLLLEFPHRCTRSLGFKMNSFVNLKHGTAFFKGSENEFSVQSFFSCIASTMYITLKKPTDIAWFSRFVPIRMNTDSDYIFKMAGGETIYDISALNMGSKKLDFTFPEYLKFRDYYRENFNKSHWKDVFDSKKDWYGFIGRNIGDMVRVAAFNSVMDMGRLEITFEDAKNVFDKLFNQMMYNIAVGPLNYNEYAILCMCEKSLEEISNKLQLNKQSVSNIIQDLKNKGLIGIDKIIKEEDKNKGWDK